MVKYVCVSLKLYTGVKCVFRCFARQPCLAFSMMELRVNEWGGGLAGSEQNVR